MRVTLPLLLSGGAWLAAAAVPVNWMYRNYGDRTGCVVGSCSSGQSVYIFDSGSRYEGEYKSGKKHGQGTFHFADSGNVYVGQWQSGKKHGYGVQVYGANGDQYKGEWANNAMHGVGTYWYSDEKEYTRQWTKGKPKPAITVKQDAAFWAKRDARVAKHKAELKERERRRHERAHDNYKEVPIMPPKNEAREKLRAKAKKKKDEL